MHVSAGTIWNNMPVLTVLGTEGRSIIVLGTCSQTSHVDPFFEVPTEVKKIDLVAQAMTGFSWGHT